MIVVNGMEYKTLQQNIYANGKKVLEAYCDGKLVYPERENTSLIKILGNIDTIVSHDHSGAVSAGSNGSNIAFYGGDSYRAKGCFSLVIRNHSSASALYFQNSTVTIPAAKWPLNGDYNERYSDGDILGPGNAWVVYNYNGITGNGLTSGNDGAHPLMGSDAIETHALYKSGIIRAIYSVELLLYLDVSAPSICSFHCDELRVGLGEPFVDAEAIPVKPYFDEVPAAVNGFHRMYSYRGDTYFGFGWTLHGPNGVGFYVNLARRTTAYSGIFCSHLKISTGQYPSEGYEVPYIIRGTRYGKTQEIEHTYRQSFKILNIPITELLYAGSELKAPEEHLHPREEDLAKFI